MELIYWSVKSSTKRGVEEVKVVLLFQPAASFTLFEKIWSSIQVIIYPLLYALLLL